MTREEYIELGAEALRLGGAIGIGEDPERARVLAEAVIEATRAWDMREFVANLGARGCENYTAGHDCKSSGRLRGGRYTAEQWCDPCEARRA